MRLLSFNTLIWLTLTGGVVTAAENAGASSAGGQRTSGRITLSDSVGGINGAQAGGRVTIGSGFAPVGHGVAVPIVTPLATTTVEDKAVSGLLIGKDGDGDTLTYSVKIPPAKGKLTLAPNGSFTYQPKAHFVGIENMSVVADDGRGNRSPPTLLTVTVTPASGGGNPDGSTGLPLRAYMLNTAPPYALNVGDANVVVVMNGSPPYTWAAGNAGVAKISDLNKDVDGDGKLDVGVVLRLTANAGGNGSLTVQDLGGARVGFTFSATAPAPAPAAEAPLITQSEKEVERFSTIGGQTPQGCRSIVQAFTGMSNTQAVGWVFDTRIQDFIGLPKEPEGGLTPDHGIFIATRVNLSMNFNGSPSNVPHSWALPSGWNLIAIPLLVDAKDQRIEPSTQDDFTLVDATGTTMADSSLSEAFEWDGTKYSVDTTYRAGRAYWVRNATAEAVVMTRNASTGAAAQPKALKGRRLDDGLRPPVPPGLHALGGDNLAGGCGGGGIGIVLLGAALMLGRNRRKG